MNPEDKRDPIHCDCGKPKMPGEVMCHTCRTGGFPPDDGSEEKAMEPKECKCCGETPCKNKGLEKCTDKMCEICGQCRECCRCTFDGDEE